MTERATRSAEIRAVFDRAKRDPRTDEKSRVVLAQVHRLGGKPGDLAKLALACQMSRERLEDCLERLTGAGYLTDDKRETRDHDTRAA